MIGFLITDGKRYRDKTIFTRRAREGINFFAFRETNPKKGIKKAKPKGTTIKSTGFIL